MRTSQCIAVRRRHQRGQALIEATVSAIALIPLVVLIVLLGKYQSIQQATIAASRALAFECTVRIDPCAEFDSHPEFVDELRRRFFSRTGSEILTDDHLPDPAAPPESVALWVDRRNRPLLEQYSDIGAAVDSQHFDAGLAVASGNGARSFGNAARLLSDLAGPGRFGLGITEGLVVARVQANLSKSQQAVDFLTQLDSLPLRPRARTAILTDAWNASGPYGGDKHSVDSRVEQGRRLGDTLEAAIDLAYLPVREFIKLADTVGVEPKWDSFDYHHIDVDRVPADRLAP